MNNSFQKLKNIILTVVVCAFVGFAFCLNFIKSNASDSEKPINMANSKQVTTTDEHLAMIPTTTRNAGYTGPKSGHLEDHPKTVPEGYVVVVDFWYSSTKQAYRVIDTKWPSDFIDMKLLKDNLTWYLDPEDHPQITKNSIESYLRINPNAEIIDLVGILDG